MSEVPVRGCGTRVKGGVYLVCGLSYDGKPVEHFIVDPPLPLNDKQRADMGLTQVGIRLVESPVHNLVHVFDWVGSDSYPNVADFIEEVKRFGMSRRAPVTFDFHKLRPGSRQVLVHARACIERPEEYQLDRMQKQEGYHWCPKFIEAHTVTKEAVAAGYEGDPYDGMCAGLWWEDVAGDGPGQFAPGYVRSVTRKMPSFEYECYAPPIWAAPQYTPGIFMTLPITGIHVINDPDTGRHERAMERLRGSKVPVELRDE